MITRERPPLRLNDDTAEAHYVEILDRQIYTFDTFVRVILDSTNEHLDSMNRNVKETVFITPSDKWMRLKLM